MSQKAIHLGLTALDKLFMTDEGRKEARLPKTSSDLPDIETRITSTYEQP